MWCRAVPAVPASRLCKVPNNPQLQILLPAPSPAHTHHSLDLRQPPGQQLPPALTHPGPSGGSPTGPSHLFPHWEHCQPCKSPGACPLFKEPSSRHSPTAQPPAAPTCNPCPQRHLQVPSVSIQLIAAGLLRAGRATALLSPSAKLRQGRLQPSICSVVAESRQRQWGLEP